MSNTELPDQTDFPVPAQIGPYRILGELGAGGMGTVYLGEHRDTGLRAAVKVLPASMAREQGFVARFNREIEAMRQVAHANENIVALYESGEDQGTYYYAMEYIPGETLTARLQREKRLPWRDVIEIGMQICRALKAAHNAGVVHRDLKPSNLLLHENGTVKLADFGVAQVFATSKLTVTGGILGTAEYMSPEQAQGRRAVRQSDIYSLGAVLYVMLTGRPPFTGKTTLEIAQKHKFSQFDSPRRIVPEIPHWLDEIVCKCLAKKPEDRFPDAYVLGLRLQEIPKKVDMAASQAEFVYSGATAGGETEVAVAGAEGQPQLGGTFIRDMMRAEMDPNVAKSPLGRWLDNVWVLLGILLLVIVVSIWLFKQNRMTPEKRLAQGVRLLEKPPGPAWDAAEAEYFQPLLDLDDPTWTEKVEPYLDQINQYQFERDVLKRGGQLRDQIPDNEPNAILQRSLTLKKNGERDAARQRLQALIAILDGSQEFAPQRELATKLLQELDAEQVKLDRYQFLEQALQRADELQQQGDTAAAQQIRAGIIALYQAEPEAAKYVERAHQGQ